MSVTVTINRINGKEGIDIGRLIRRMDLIGSDRKDIKRILNDVGQMMSSEARMVAKREDIISTGRLINTIKHRISSQKNKITVTVGPVGTFYARFQELGANRNPASRAAMFARLRELGRIGDRGAKPGFSNTIHRPRPFLKPAFDQHAFKTIGMIRELLRKP